MPSEPAESNFKNKVRTVAYPTHERGGIIWAYMGPRETPPPLPDLEANMLGDDQASIYLIFRDCNWMQGWEGEMDTVHPPSCTSAPTASQDTAARHLRLLHARQRDARFSVLDTEFGTAATAPTARPKTTATTGASRTCCSRSTP